MKSNTRGEIWMENVPAGKYVMWVAAPETKKGDFVVQVKPESQQINVAGGFSVNATQEFQVFGGTLGGLVLGLGGNPAREVEIILNGKKTSGITNMHGRYVLRGSDLENASTEEGQKTFTLSAAGFGWTFDTFKVTIDAENTELPPVNATGIQLCGKVAVLDDNNEL